MTENRKMRMFACFALFPWPNEKEVWLVEQLNDIKH